MDEGTADSRVMEEDMVEASESDKVMMGVCE